MKIRNTPVKTSKRTIYIMLIFSIAFTLMIWAFIYFSSAKITSIMDFFSWYISSFWTCYNNSESLLLSLIVFVLFPIFVYGGLVVSIIEHKKAIRDFGSSLHLTSVEFLPDRVNLNFNMPQCNVVCGYEDIESLDMIIHTVYVYTKSGGYPKVNEIELNFSLFNNKVFSLKNTPILVMNFIYSVMDYAKRINNFSYSFSGYGQIVNIKEKIADYQNKGIKQILSTSQENSFKLMSITFFLMSMYFLYQSRESISLAFDRGLFAIFLVPVLLFLGVSFIIDVILIIDKIKERTRGF